MTINTDQVNKIYELLGDEESREVFSKRLMYTLVPTPRNIRELIRINLPDFIDAVHRFTDNGDKVYVYGIGKDYWHPGRRLCYLFRDVLGGAFDKNADEIGSFNYYGLRNQPVQRPEAIRELSRDIVMLVATPNPVFQNEIYTMLLHYGVPAERIQFLPPLLSLRDENYFMWPFLRFGTDEALVDCGCLDGKNCHEFFERASIEPNASVRKIFAYEPESRQFEECKKSLKELPFAEVRELAAWDKKDVLTFAGNSDVQYGGVISATGEQKINAVALDDDLKGERITYIKMDIEGAEMNALKGAEKLIRENRPTLAISAYHKPMDILDIPQYIIDLDLNYSFYLRHQSLCEFDTVLYAVPK